MAEETSIGGQAREFPSTRWTMIVASRVSLDARQAALEELLTVYWKPLYYYLRRKGWPVEKAKDGIQGFLAHLLEHDFLSRLDPSRGRFRGYLRTSLDHYLANLYESQSAKKRGGGARAVAVDFDLAESGLAESAPAPDAAYDREWALGVMERSLNRLREEFQDGTRRGPYQVVVKFFQPGEAPTYEEAAKGCGMTLVQFKAFLHRARERFRELVREEVAHTVVDSRETDAEVAELVRALKS